MKASDRILQFIEMKGFSESKKGKSLRQFYSECGLVNGAIKPGRGLSTDTLEKIFHKYDTLNMDWVVTGREPMLYISSNQNLNDMKDNFEVMWKEVPAFLKIYLEILHDNGLRFTPETVYYSKDETEYNTDIHSTFFEIESKGKQSEYKYKLLKIIERFALLVSYAISNPEFTAIGISKFKEKAINMYYEKKKGESSQAENLQ